MRKVLKALRKVEFKLKLKKCEFVKKQLKYLRFIVKKFRIKSNLKKVRIILEQLTLIN